MAKLLNYTTEIPASRTVAEIYALLSEGGARAIMSEYDGSQKPTGICFQLITTFGPIMYRLPANVTAAQTVLNAMTKRTGRDKIPDRYYNDRDQAERVAWRIVRDWVEVQLAIHQLGQAKLEQIMLPFAVTPDGRTYYERVVERGSLALPEPKKEEPRPVGPVTVGLEVVQ
ncbi:MAG: hypothetical protein SFV32_12545 [Opitutaceae bacterium]|nr:hypothetical protein [Opitutaceae bacterium]